MIEQRSDARIGKTETILIVGIEIESFGDCSVSLSGGSAGAREQQAPASSAL